MNWAFGLLRRLYFGVSVLEFTALLRGTLRYRAQDPKAVSQIGSICLFELSILTSEARLSHCSGPLVKSPFIKVGF
jgi:hypothetical protein